MKATQRPTSPWTPVVSQFTCGGRGAPEGSSSAAQLHTTSSAVSSWPCSEVTPGRSATR